MSVQIPIRSIALAAPLLVWGAGFGMPAQAKSAKAADDCLTAPNSPAAEGQHWYYHTDRKKGRKCWFLRDVKQPQQSAAKPGKSAATPTTPAHAAKKPAPEPAPAGTAKTTGAVHRAPSPAAKAQAAPEPAPASSATTSEPVQQDLQTKNATATFPDPPTAYASEPSKSEAPAAAPTVPITWPDLRPVETIKIRKPNSNLNMAAANAVQPTGTVRTPPAQTPPAPKDAAPSVAPAKAKQAQITEIVSSGMTPVQMALVAASALAVAGLLYHLVIGLAARRRRNDVLNFVPPVWADDPLRRPWRNERWPQASEPEPQQPAAEAEPFVDGAHVSLVPAASDDGARRQARATDAHRMYAPRKAAVAPATRPISEHENNLAQLIRDLDQLLQTRKGA